MSIITCVHHSIERGRDESIAPAPWMDTDASIESPTTRQVSSRWVGAVAPSDHLSIEERPDGLAEFFFDSISTLPKVAAVLGSRGRR